MVRGTDYCDHSTPDSVIILSPRPTSLCWQATISNVWMHMQTQAGDQTAFDAWYTTNREHVSWLVQNFTNIVCMVAYVFRAKGHHFVEGQDYGDTYDRIWNKVNSTRNKLESACKNTSTIGLHAILPLILDRYWGWVYKRGCCAPPPGLLHRVAAAGTASLMGLYVGWQDAKNTYGKVLTDVEEAEAAMVTIMDEIH